MSRWDLLICCWWNLSAAPPVYIQTINIGVGGIFAQEINRWNLPEFRTGFIMSTKTGRKKEEKENKQATYKFTTQNWPSRKELNRCGLTHQVPWLVSTVWKAKNTEEYKAKGSGFGGSCASSYLADLTSPNPSLFLKIFLQWCLECFPDLCVTSWVNKEGFNGVLIPLTKVQ